MYIFKIPILKSNSLRTSTASLTALSGSHKFCNDLFTDVCVISENFALLNIYIFTSYEIKSQDTVNNIFDTYIYEYLV